MTTKNSLDTASPFRDALPCFSGSLRGSPNEFPDINLDAGARRVLGRSKDLAADFFRDVRLAAIGAHFYGDGLED
jgi:hypothetical protein